jgi:hypothetical protein
LRHPVADEGEDLDRAAVVPLDPSPHLGGRRDERERHGSGDTGDPRAGPALPRLPPGRDRADGPDPCQPPARPAEHPHARDGLLTGVAALVEVDVGGEQPDLLGQHALRDLVPRPGNAEHHLRRGQRRLVGPARPGPDQGVEQGVHAVGAHDHVPPAQGDLDGDRRRTGGDVGPRDGGDGRRGRLTVGGPGRVLRHRRDPDDREVVTDGEARVLQERASRQRRHHVGSLPLVHEEPQPLDPDDNVEHRRRRPVRIELEGGGHGPGGRVPEPLGQHGVEVGEPVGARHLDDLKPDPAGEQAGRDAGGVVRVHGVSLATGRGGRCEGTTTGRARRTSRCPAEWTGPGLPRAALWSCVLSSVPGGRTTAG